MAGMNVLLIEHESVTTKGIRAVLSAMGYEVVAIVDDADNALKIARHVKPDLIILDISQYGETAWISSAEKIRGHGEIPFLLIVAPSWSNYPGLAMLPPQFDYYILPLEEEKLQITINMVLKKYALEIRLKKSEERYRTIAELGDDMIFIVNRERVLEYANSVVMMRFSSDSHNSDFKKPYDEVLAGELIKSLDNFISRVIWWGEKIHRQDQVRTPYGIEWYETLLIPMKSKNNLVNAVIVVSRDITDRVRFEEKLREKGIRQIEKNNEQFQILNDQIRNPLQVIKSIIELEENPYQEKVLEQVAIIDSIVTRLDEGWLESEKVRRFLIEHYHHGNPECREKTGLISH
ncbi:MAG: PAS domain-containing protein [Methanoregulaceae archaeon]|nr:PAS domain-containing protein [Methanoregulaceae archaeon]